MTAPGCTAGTGVAAGRDGCTCGCGLRHLRGAAALHGLRALRAGIGAGGAAARLGRRAASRAARRAAARLHAPAAPGARRSAAPAAVQPARRRLLRRGRRRGVRRRAAPARAALRGSRGTSRGAPAPRARTSGWLAPDARGRSRSRTAGASPARRRRSAGAPPARRAPARAPVRATGGAATDASRAAARRAISRTAGESRHWAAAGATGWRVRQRAGRHHRHRMRELAVAVVALGRPPAAGC